MCLFYVSYFCPMCRFISHNNVLLKYLLHTSLLWKCDSTTCYIRIWACFYVFYINVACVCNRWKPFFFSKPKHWWGVVNRIFLNFEFHIFHSLRFNKRSSHLSRKKWCRKLLLDLIIRSRVIGAHISKWRQRQILKSVKIEISL